MPTIPRQQSAQGTRIHLAQPRAPVSKDAAIDMTLPNAVQEDDSTPAGGRPAARRASIGEPATQPPATLRVAPSSPSRADSDHESDSEDPVLVRRINDRQCAWATLGGIVGGVIAGGAAALVSRFVFSDADRRDFDSTPMVLTATAAGTFLGCAIGGCWAAQAADPAR